MIRILLPENFMPTQTIQRRKRAYDGAGFRLSETPHEIRGAAPLIGEHTWEVCESVLGLQPEEIGSLMAEQILY